MIELPVDGWDYNLVTKGVELSKDVEGACVEIGLRRGGGTKFIIDAIAEFCPNKVSIAIDPYGNIVYEDKEKHFVKLDYTEDMKADCLSNLYAYIKEKQVHFIFFNLEDSEFFKRYADGFPIYRESKTQNEKYSFIHFDGPHAVQAVLDEVNFFLQRIDKGAVFCFDNITDYYNHDIVEEYILEKGFKLIDKTYLKGLYQYQP